ncbi:hypothetical protein BDN72DRAFT_485695 [Pluteus cervinus]|uniref:Uncharacterized protein n=1 Tax=Pluteus cervinus TaxID=181527 RepID=A0ACD3A651_9AGAR|nr:hypothetical protein BDN72DRAFT_485695 [Pluteus cervinus]
MNPNSPSQNIADLDPAEPRLPPEIEREILVLAFHTSTIASRANLLLISKRAFTWLNPITYQVVAPNESIGGEYTPPPTFLSKYGSHVLHVRTTNSDSSCSESSILSLCPNITNLVIWTTISSETVPKLFRLSNLKRLSFHCPGDLEDRLRELYDDRGISKDPAMISRRKWCSNITHLAWGSITYEQSVPLLTQFPNLTHVLLGAWNSVNIVLQILKFCPGLKVLISLLANFGPSEKTFAVDVSPEGRAIDVGDIRVVTIEGELVKDWLRGSWGGDDMWIIAERRVEERRRLKRLADSGACN